MAWERVQQQARSDMYWPSSYSAEFVVCTLKAMEQALHLGKHAFCLLQGTRCQQNQGHLRPYACQHPKLGTGCYRNQLAQNRVAGRRFVARAYLHHLRQQNLTLSIIATATATTTYKTLFIS